jgi:hypothetical protein
LEEEKERKHLVAQLPEVANDFEVGTMRLMLLSTFHSKTHVK